MADYAIVKDGRCKSISRHRPENMGGTIQADGSEMVLIDDGEDVLGKAFSEGEFVSDAEHAEREQTLYDGMRRAMIERLEREAQTKLLEAIAEKIGAVLPDAVGVIRQIRAADNIGDTLPEIK